MTELVDTIYAIPARAIQIDKTSSFLSGTIGNRAACIIVIVSRVEASMFL